DGKPRMGNPHHARGCLSCCFYSISYAGEDVDIARAIWTQLRDEFRIFFAPEEKAYLWGEDLNGILPHIYGQDSRYVLVLSSKTYVRKHWTREEFRITLRAMRNRLLLVDLGAIPAGMPKDVVYRPGSTDSLISLIPVLRNKLSAPAPVQVSPSKSRSK